MNFNLRSVKNARSLNSSPNRSKVSPNHCEVRNNDWEYCGEWEYGLIKCQKMGSKK
jgi:hypothetical protein